MSCAVGDEMQRLVREAALPAQPGDSVKAQIGRAARRLGLPFGRTRSHWYGLARAVLAEEAEMLRARRRQLMIERAHQLEQEAAAIRAHYSQQDAA